MARRKLKSATDQRPFILLYQDFLESDLLDSSYQKLVYIYLKKFANSKNQCFPSINKLSKYTKISVNKVKATLNELEQKGVIARESRTRPDGGKSSNLYTLYDFKELWDPGSSTEIKEAIRREDEQKAIKLLEGMGYVIRKEKELESEPAKVQNQAIRLNQFDIDIDNITPNFMESQYQERYTAEEIRQLFDYDIMVKDIPYRQQDIESVMDILYTAMNTTKATIRIAGEDKPSMVVISKLMKLNKESILYSIEKFSEQTGRIKNPTSYMLTILYNAPEQFNFDIHNQVSHDMANLSSTDRQ